MNEDRNGTYYSKADILKKMKNWIKKYNLSNYLTLGEDEVLHINEDFKKKVDKLVQDNPNGFVKYVIKILGYDNIVKGVAENIFKKIEPTDEELGIDYITEYENIVKEFLKSGKDDYVDDFGNFKSAVSEYYESKEPEIKKLLKTSDIADTFKVINGLQHLNWEIYYLQGEVDEYIDRYDTRLEERADSSYKYDLAKRREKYHKLKEESVKLNRLKENLNFTKKLYSETLTFTNKLAEIFLHKKGRYGGFDFRYNDDETREEGFKNNYFDQWKIKDEIKPLSNSKRLLNDVQNYLFKKYDVIEERFNSVAYGDEEEKKIF